MRHADPRQLSLFGDAAATPPAPGPLTNAQPIRRLGAPPNPPPPRESPAALSVRPLALPPGCSWHELALDGLNLGYTLRRSRRRTIGLVIRDAGLMIQAPAWTTRRQIEDAIQQKAGWILSKLQAHHQRLDQLALQTEQWRAGGRIPYLGVLITLCPDGASALRYDGDPAAPADGDRLILPLPAAADSGRIQERTQAWLQARAHEDLGQRLVHFLQRAGQSIQGWGLSGAQARWGSCSSQRRIRLNWRLIHLEPALIDYVVAHEVAHLKELNHSPAFWREVERLCPTFQAAREQLKRHHPGTLPLF